jgi:hypothetical protein
VYGSNKEVKDNTFFSLFERGIVELLDELIPGATSLLHGEGGGTKELKPSPSLSFGGTHTIVLASISVLPMAFGGNNLGGFSKAEGAPRKNSTKSHPNPPLLCNNHYIPKTKRDGDEECAVTRATP